MRLEIYRSKRRTLSVGIAPDGEGYVVRAPAGLSEEYIKDFIENKKDALAKMRERIIHRQTFFAPYENFEKLSFLGIDYQIVKQNGLKKAVLHENTVYVDGKNAQKQLKNFLRLAAAEILPKLTDECCKKHSLGFRSLAVRSYKGKWGSCSKDIDIVLNYKLAMLEPPLIEYVIIHELCHAFHMDHSKLFWLKLSKYLPEARKLNKKLKIYTPFCRLF